jgi:sodium-dependent phosphate cotransporter
VFKSRRANTVLRIVLLVLLFYLFLVGIRLTGISFKLFGQEFAEQLITLYSNPFVGLFTGILVTSIIQSSSTTTSLIVGLAGSGLLPIESAIPMVMGANMGTTITNILVSLTFITRKEDFRRAFAAATVHDFFNLLTIIVLFPLEMYFHIIEKSALFLTDIFQGVGGVTFTSPLKVIIGPAVKSLENFLLDTVSLTDVVAGIIMLVVALVLVITSLVYFVRTIRFLTNEQTEKFIDKYLFRNTVTALILGMVLTAIVQSSSVTTSMIVPLVAAGLLGLNRAYPYTLGANVGTTITAILASLATVSSGDGQVISTAGVTVAFCHLIFNIYGIIIFLPLKRIPIYLATRLADFSADSKIWAFAFVAIVFFIIPLLIIFLSR